ncbi:energy transducer TonB, partial [Vibrio parahaemolyticus]|nr:energy transducer TonB [Vibrio parahaemolyticus]EGR0336059.1 energy transducer TonB [Vibrio parahaemolyticus]EGR0944252.1 energy transducer TonB [Vibrio parahaemolyticus]
PPPPPPPPIPPSPPSPPCPAIQKAEISGKVQPSSLNPVPP